jgi:galactose-1-phosphate uridylyltransferase
VTAGIELRVGTYVNDTQPESTAAELRQADLQPALGSGI